MEVFRDYLKENGFKVTPERLAAGRIAFSFKKQFTIKDLQTKIQDLGWPISLPTLYRTLSLLEEAGFVKTVYCSESGQKQFISTDISASNIKMRCTHCDKVVKVEARHYNKICRELCAAYDFNDITNFNFTIEGCCNECIADKNNEIEFRITPLQGKSPVKVLLFDDDKDILETLGEYLCDNDYDVETYSDPSKWRCCKSGSDVCPIDESETCTDIIITDIRMPNMTGVDFIRSLEKKKCKVKNIAFMTGAANEDQLQFVQDNGYKLFKKPFNLDEIESWIKSCEHSRDFTLA